MFCACQVSASNYKASMGHLRLFQNKAEPLKASFLYIYLTVATAKALKRGLRATD